MLHCPNCNSTDHKVSDSKPRDVQNGKARRRICLKCDMRFTTLESVYAILELPKRTKKTEPPSKPIEKPRKRKLVTRKKMPSVEVEPDFDSMSDEELESWIFNKN